jgi:hypothetical protein
LSRASNRIFDRERALTAGVRGIQVDFTRVKKPIWRLFVSKLECAMSLIGSLEDLGLGDILQIIHLSQKSGVLSIRAESGEGRIVLHDGLVRLAHLKGGPDDLRGLLVDRGFVSSADFDAAAESARTKMGSLSTELSSLASLAPERLDSLRRENIENAVGEMFSWDSGEFSFDVGAEEEYLAGDMALSVGLSAQYLAMESARIDDERGRDGEQSESTSSGVADPSPESGLNLELSAQEMFGVVDEPASQSAASMDALVSSTAERVDPVQQASNLDATSESIGDSLAGAHVLEIVGTQQSIGRESQPPVVVIDDRLGVLEWVRRALTDHFANVHVFQRSQEGLGRIRQYLARAQTPILLVSPKIEGNPLSGIVDAADFVQRLRGQAPRMPILWLLSEGEADGASLPVALPTVVHPSIGMLADANSEQQLQRLAESMVASLSEQTARSRSDNRQSNASNSSNASSEDLERLKVATEALCDSSNRGEVLPLAIRFAAESFERVAMFMVRDDQIFGMAQHGIDRMGGPDDVEMRGLRFESTESSWFAEVIETRGPIRASIRNAGDQRFCDLIGGRAQEDSYIAPILSAERVVALLYADNGQRADGPGDTSALEVVLHHAGLALDRTALARALAEVSDDEN